MVHANKKKHTQTNQKPSPPYSTTIITNKPNSTLMRAQHAPTKTPTQFKRTKRGRVTCYADVTHFTADSRKGITGLGSGILSKLLQKRRRIRIIATFQPSNKNAAQQVFVSGRGVMCVGFFFWYLFS